MTAAEALAAALAVLENEQLAAFVEVGDALDGLVVDCRVGREEFHVPGGAALAVQAGGAGRQARVHVVAERGVILDLVDGEIDILGALRARRLDVRGDVALLVRLSRAQRAFAEGTARSRSMRTVLDAFRFDRSEAA